MTRGLPRLTLIPFLLWALLVGLVISMVMCASGAHAALNYRAMGGNGQMAGLRLSEAPCTQEKVLVHIKEPFRTRFKAAVLTWGGRDWHSCWTTFEAENEGRMETMVFSVDEEGSVFNPTPLRLFREDAI